MSHPFSFQTRKQKHIHWLKQNTLKDWPPWMKKI